MRILLEITVHYIIFKLGKGKRLLKYFKCKFSVCRKRGILVVKSKIRLVDVCVAIRVLPLKELLRKGMFVNFGFLV